MLLTLLLLGYWAVAAAQVPPVDEPEPGAAEPPTEAAEGVVPEEDAAPGEEAANAEAADTDESEDAATAGSESAGTEAGATAGATADVADEVPVDDSLAGPAATVEEDSAIEASAEEEFDPDEEISEDYPVPLPSDI
jgi:hypothetical protein